MLTSIALELRRMTRDLAFLVFGVALPVVMYLLFTNVGGGDGDKGAHDTAAMIGMAAYGALGAALANGTGVAEDRGRGWLRQLRITPLTPLEVVGARAVTGSLVVLPSIVAVLGAGFLVNGVRMPVLRALALVAVLWLGTLPFTLLGLGNGYRLSAQSTGMVNTAASMGLSIIGGLWIPLSAFPDWFGSIAEWTPTNRFAQLGWDVSEGSLPALGAVAVLAGWFALFGAYAAAAYRKSTHSR
ncbi:MULTISPECIES: ABC transporter permease [unclassified Streptomyces]|uniref:ABC transporter permease n=1 Tax=unclassified Streptomyces TaxID=2593676 RepID=UPI00336A2029